MVVPDEVWADAQTLWDYHQLDHELRSCSAAIALGSYDLGVATYAAALFKKNLFPVVVFTGATSATSVDRFPAGEAVTFRGHALSLGLPDSAILVEPAATNTGENFSLSRHLLHRRGFHIDSVMVICMPYMQRRAFATCAKQWPDVSTVCASEPISMRDYVKAIGDTKLVIDELAGDLQRIIDYPKRGFATQQAVPSTVEAAYRRLVDAGYDSRVLPAARLC